MRKWRMCQRVLALVGLILLWAIAQPAPARADLLQLAQVSCTDGTNFNVELDSDSLNQLQDAINNIDLQDLAGWTCSLTLLGTVLVADRLGAITLVDSTSTAHQFSAGGGTASGHFAYAAQQADDGTFSGYAVLDNSTITLPDGSSFTGQVKGQVTCEQTPVTRLTIFTFQVQGASGSGSDPTGTFVHVSAQDGGSANTGADTLDVTAVDASSACEGGSPATPVSSGNVVVKGP